MLDLSGYVLRAPRSATSNSKTTDEAVSGVPRDFKPLPSAYQLESPQLVSLLEDQYRTAVLREPNGEVDYLVWAANTATLRGSVQIVTELGWTIPTGSLPVTQVVPDPDPNNPFDTQTEVELSDGTDRLFLSAEQGSIGSVLGLTLRRGDTGALVPVLLFDFAEGWFTILSQASKDALGGGLSRSRGDSLANARALLSGPTFWWTKNDSSKTRFFWEGRTGRWAPKYGTSVGSPGKVGDSIRLSPIPLVPVGSRLPGDPLTPESLAALRVGSRPNESSQPVRVLVSDDAAELDNVDAILKSDGTVLFSDSFQDSFAGVPVWFNGDEFVETRTQVGMLGQDVAISPVPMETDRPILRLGSRTPLTQTMVETETELAFLQVDEGQVGVAMSTGQLKFSETDIAKSDPSSSTFDPSYLSVPIYYDGVSLNQKPLGLKQPAMLVGPDGFGTTVSLKGELFLQDATLSKSGVLFTLDGTGRQPSFEGGIGVRPAQSGLVRTLGDLGDLVLFSESGQIKTLKVVSEDDEVPKYAFKIPKSTAYLDLRPSLQGSPVYLSREDRKAFSGRAMYFLQAQVTPSVWASQARVFSRKTSFSLAGTEIFQFRINESVFVWDASLDPGGVQTSLGGVFTAQELQVSLSSVVSGLASVGVSRGRLVLQSDLKANGSRWGEVEIGYSLDANGALGFLPGWLVRIGNPQSSGDLGWLPDSGVSLGVFRDPSNLDGRKPLPDIKHLSQYVDQVVSKSVQENPIFFLNRPPLENLPGYDYGVFFQAQVGLETRLLQSFENLVGDYPNNRVLWAEEVHDKGVVSSPVLEIGLSARPAFEQSFRLPGNGLRVSRLGSTYQNLAFEQDYLVENSSSLVLVERVGGFLDSGSLGSLSGDQFEDPTADFTGLPSFTQLDVLSGESKGVYEVQEVLSATQLRVSPVFSTTESRVPWELYEGLATDLQNPGIIADVQYLTFEHLPEDPFRVRVLSSLGTMPIGEADQFQFRRKAILGTSSFGIRVGEPNSSPFLTGKPLKTVSLGNIQDSGLKVPVGTERFDGGYFEIRLGLLSVPFVKVAAFSETLPNGIVEIRNSDGVLAFSANLLSEFENFEVLYAETFLDPIQCPIELSQGTFEYDSVTGELNFSTFDMAETGLDPIFLVESMTSFEGDVILNPISGTFFFPKALRELQRVEADYFLAENGSGDLFLVDGNPVRVIEFLSVQVELELATPESEFVWAFNPTDRSLDSLDEVDVYIGPTKCNVGSSPQAAIQGNRVIFKSPVPTDSVVRVSYKVTETFGGEQSFTTSRRPVYRPPFRIPEGQESFTLEGQRNLQVGSLLRVGQFPFYLTQVSYDPAADETLVSFLPETQVEAGSRDPSLNSLSLISDRPLALDNSPGFWEAVSVSFEPFNRGAQSVFYQGDLTRIAVAGHLLEIGGVPFIISGSTLEGNTRTEITITSVFPRGFNSDQDSTRISVRPVYPVGATSFLGVGAFLEDKPFQLIRFRGQPLPGVIQTLGLDYQIDSNTGGVQLLQESLQEGESLYLRQTKRSLLGPEVAGGQTYSPRYLADYAVSTTPSEQNGLLGATLRASYTFEAPDTWFVQVLPFEQYLAQVAQDVSAASDSIAPSSGSPPAGFSGLLNREQGRLGLLGQLSDLEDQDRAARAFIEFFDQTTQGFEQILETISGDRIGDRDGKFRFFIGRGQDLIPPGYEDPITGRLNRRNVFGEVWFAENRDLILESSDPVVDPRGATLQDGSLVGRYPNPDSLETLKDRQRALIANDIDDIVLVSRTKKRLRLFPLRLESFGRFRLLGEPSQFSRLFPERMTAFTLLDPGIGSDLESDPIDPGVYAFSKYEGKFALNGNGVQIPERVSTFQKPIGEIGNPVYGEFGNLSSISARERLPRAVVVRFSPVGFPELDEAIIAEGGLGFSSNPRPAVMATPLPLRDFPIDSTGGPDLLQLAAQGGETFDLSTGDADLFTPAFFTLASGFPKVAFGRPDGSIVDVTTGVSVPFQFPPGTDSSALQSVYVKEVLLGCVLTFADQDGNSFGQIQQISPDPQETSGLFEPLPGDTVFVMPANVDVGGNPNDPLSQTQRETQLSGMPEYRTGFDLKVDRQAGTYVDISLPSFFDPSLMGLKETFGQRPPKPMSAIEADVTFVNSREDALEIPALKGQNLSDSGDRTIPYVGGSLSETYILGQAQKRFGSVLEVNPNGLAVYPDEVQGVDGLIADGVLTTAQDLLPGDGPGIADVREFDFLLVETGQTLPLACQGILSVGAVRANRVVPPRFVSPTKLGDRIRYRFENAIAFVNQPIVPNPPGMVVSRSGVTTTFDTVSISTAFVVFNDGTPMVVSGGLNSIFDPGGVLAYPNNGNVVRLKLWSGPTFLQTILIEINNGVPQVTGDLGTFPLLAVPAATDTQILIQTAAPFLSIGFLLPPELPEDLANPGQSLPLWFSVEVDTSDATAGSFTGAISTDRVSFIEAFSLKAVPLRGEPPVAAISVEGALEMFSVTGSGTEDLTVNNPAEVNAGSPFTFLRPGSFGRIEVAGFDGFGNQLVSGSQVSFSALASTLEDSDGLVIAQGFGSCESVATITDSDNRIAFPSVSLAGVLPGDVCVIPSDNLGSATTKSGTYLVKHAVDPNVGVDYRALNFQTLTKPVNTGVGCFQVDFPKVTLVDIDQAVVEISETTLSDLSSAWPPTGRIYFLRSVLDLTQTISLEFVGLAGTAFQILQGSGQDAFGAPVPDSEFAGLVGTMVSGFSFVDVDYEAESQPRNLVGFQGDGSYDFAFGGSGLGFREIEISNVGSVAWQYEIVGLSGPGNLVVGVPGFEQLGIAPHPPIANTSFVNDPKAIVYPNVANKLTLQQVSVAQWTAIHGLPAVSCLAPGDSLVSDFRAQAGVFFEPSTPRPVLDCLGPNSLVVDASHSLAASQIGFRDGPSFGAAVTPELVSFEIRRVRRWHDALANVGELLEPLKYLYQTRMGVISAYGPKAVGPNQTIWSFVLEAVGGTNLGPFDQAGVNPNDLFRVFENGALVDQVEIVAVEDGETLLLRAPGLSGDPVGKAFEIWLRQPAVPHEQSHDQLLGLMTETILDRGCDYQTLEGGFVPVEPDPADPRRLKDPAGFAGSQVGDLLLIDPQGDLAGPGGIPSTGLERGSRAFGDRSVPSRDTAEGGQAVPFAAGAPSELDDNRGFYWITEVGSDWLKVSSATAFSAEPGEPPEIFGEVVQYAVLPTVSASQAPFAIPPGGPGTEGQMDLRPTAFAGEVNSPVNSFRGNRFSVAPISYRVLRPSPAFSQEAIETMLLSRERTLSWMGEFDVFFRGDKYGSYFVFQKDQHISDLGDPLIPDEGKGVMSNELVDGVRGLVDISPFANASDCLSILDRRFWILDSRLDREFPPDQVGVPSYSALENADNVPGAQDGDGRPVLPDLILDVLDNNDRLRERRFFWIQARTDRSSGFLRRISLSESEYRKRRADFIRRAALTEGLES